MMSQCANSCSGNTQTSVDIAWVQPHRVSALCLLDLSYGPMIYAGTRMYRVGVGGGSNKQPISAEFRFQVSAQFPMMLTAKC